MVSILLTRKIKKSEEGSLTVEMILFLLVFLMFFVCLLNITNLVITQTVIQYALNQSAKEVSEFSYIITKAGLEDNLMNNAEGSSTMVGNTADMVESIDKFTGTFGGLVNDPFNLGGYETLADDAQGMVDQGKSYADYLKSNGKKDIIATAKDFLVQGASGLVLNAFVRNRIETHLNMLVPGIGADKLLEGMGVIDGLEGIKVPISQAMYTDGKKDLNLVVTYKIKYDAVFFDMKPFTVTLRASTGLW